MRHQAAEVCAGAQRRSHRPLSVLLLASTVAPVVVGDTAAASAPGRHLSWGSFSAEASNPTFDDHKGPIVIGPVGAAGGALLSQQSTDAVAGIVESFLHKQRLEPGEMDCLVNGTGKLAGTFMTVSQSLVTLVQEILAGKNGLADSDDDDDGDRPQINDEAGGISAMVDAMQAEEKAKKARAATAEHNDKQSSQSLAFFYGSRRLQMSTMAMSAPMMLMQLAYSCHKIVELTQKIVDKCVKGDALKAFKIAGMHMKNLQYVSGHLVANGADIVQELADAALEYQNRNFRDFGRHAGTAMRKVLLSRSATATLPEGMPSKFVLANVTAGVLRGFFGRGFALDIKPRRGYDPLRIDLHHCVGKNLMFFQSVWASTMLFYARKESRKRDADPGKDDDTAPMGATLAITMMQIPTALKRCNIGEDEENMLMDSIKSMKRIHWHLRTPSVGTLTKDQMAADLATTVKTWGKGDWYQFGLDLGRLLQEMFVAVYSQEYAASSDGTLQRRIVGASAAQQGLLPGAAAGARSAPAAVAALAASVLLLLLVARGHRAFVNWEYGRSGASARPANADLEAYSAE